MALARSGGNAIEASLPPLVKAALDGAKRIEPSNGPSAWKAAPAPAAGGGSKAPATIARSRSRRARS